MSLKEAVTIFESLAPISESNLAEIPENFAYAGQSNCQLLQKVVPENGPGIFKFGDALIDCPHKITFYGIRPQEFRAYFIEDKLVFISISKLETKEEKEFPPAYKALADKFKVTPEIKLTKTLDNSVTGMKVVQYSYEAVFKDTQGSLISAFGKKGIIESNLGNVFEADSSIEYTMKGYEEIWKKRQAIAEQAVIKIQKQQQQEGAQKLKNDL